MNVPKIFSLALAMSLLLVLPACKTSTNPPAAAAIRPVPAELCQTNYLYEIVRHLYRWQLDEAEVESVVGSKQFIFWVRGVDHKLDPGDNSQLGEIILPQLNLSVHVKKADYRIEELGTTVKSDNFKINQIIRGQAPARKPQDCVAVAVDMKEMREYLFRTRSQHDYPNAALIARLREALRAEATKEGSLRTNNTAGEQVIDLAPLSPIANECWVYWEAGRKLFYFGSDIDLSNPAVWQHEELMVHIYDLEQQVIVTHEEAPGSNRFLTRYQAGRALFNCLILGQRVTVPPYVPTNTPSQQK